MKRHSLQRVAAEGALLEGCATQLTDERKKGTRHLLLMRKVTASSFDGSSCRNWSTDFLKTEIKRGSKARGHR